MTVLLIGGAHQGKAALAARLYPNLPLVTGLHVRVRDELDAGRDPMALLGGLANGLVTGTFSGALGVEAAALVPFAWPSRLATLPLEASIASSMGAAGQAQALASAWTTVALACAVLTAVVAAAVLACANRFEGRRGGE